MFFARAKNTSDNISPADAVPLESVPSNDDDNLLKFPNDTSEPPQTHDHQSGIALALGGGAARGWSHIGVLRALDEANIPVRMIAGTSVGALVGGCYLAGKLDELEEFARSLTPRRTLGFLDINFRGNGLISGLKLAERMQEHLGEMNIEDLDRPLVCVATEIHTGHEVWLSKGPMIDAIRASYALPGIFEPVTLNNRVLVDGALVNPVPVPVCRGYEAEAVIAVNLSSDAFGRGTIVRNADDERASQPLTSLETAANNGIGNGAIAKLGKALGVSGVMVEAFNIIQDRIARSRLAGDPPDLTITPGVGDIGLAEFHRADEAIDAGYDATKIKIERLNGLAAQV